MHFFKFLIQHRRHERRVTTWSIKPRAIDEKSEYLPE
jgi:hypothetical protein